MKTLNACKVGIALTAAAFLGIATAKPAAAISFSLTDLGTLGGNSTSAAAINNLGQVVGTARTADGQNRAFFWENSSGMTNLGIIPPNDFNYCNGYYIYGYGYRYGPCPSSTSSSGVAINDLGQVIGTSTTAYQYSGVLYNYYVRPYEQNTFLWDKNSGMTNLVQLRGFSQPTALTAINNLGQIIGYTLGTNRFNSGQYPFFWEQNTGRIDLTTPIDFQSTLSSANAINNLGQVVGRISRPGYNEPYRAFLWEKGSGIRYLGTLGREYGSANDINDLGQVVGESTTTDGKSRAFFWDKNGGMINLGALGSYYRYGYLIDRSSATAINDLGQVIGSSSTANGQDSAFFWDKSSGMINLGTLGAYNSDNYSNPIAINKLGQVIGTSTSANGRQRPFFWDKNSGMRDLNDLISDLGWTLDSVLGINNAGQIVGNGLYNGQQRAFVLTPNSSKPIPEPSSALAFLALGAFGAGSLAKRKRLQQEASTRN